MARPDVPAGEGGGEPSGREDQRRPYRVRLPGFVRDEDIGLGEMFTRVAATAGLRPCGGCAGRREALDRWVVLSGRR